MADDKSAESSVVRLRLKMHHAVGGYDDDGNVNSHGAEETVEIAIAYNKQEGVWEPCSEVPGFNDVLIGFVSNTGKPTIQCRVVERKEWRYKKRPSIMFLSHRQPILPDGFPDPNE